MCPCAISLAPAKTSSAQEALQGGERGERMGAGGVHGENSLLFLFLKMCSPFDAPSKGDQLDQERGRGQGMGCVCVCAALKPGATA